MVKAVHYIIVILLISTSLITNAQVPDAAAKHYNEALRLRKNKADSTAYLTMQKAINTYRGYAAAYSTMGEWYFTDRKYDKAVDIFVQASKNCKDGNTAFALPLARSLLYALKPAQALQLIVSYGNNSKNKEWEKLRRQGRFMQDAMNNMLKDTVYNMGVRINTRYPEMYPSISADTQHLYFTRKVKNVDMDFYHTTIDSCGGWFTGRNLGSPTNTPNHEAAQTISADGHYLFFMRCDNRSENGWDQGGCDLYMSYTADTNWSVAQSFGATINTPAYEGMPCLSPDNRDLYFVSDKEGGYGGLDIWVSRFEDGLWQMPRNLGPQINTAGDETAPFIHIDNRTLYFSSNGLTGMGGSDLFYSRRVNDTTWGQPTNMGYPINTPDNENSISITIDGKKAYLSSDRDSLEGNYDIYETMLPPQLQPVPIAVLKGHTYDSLTKQRLNYASVNILDAVTGEKLYRFVTNRGDASFMITLPIGKKYAYDAYRIGYMSMQDTLSLIGYDNKVTEPLNYSIPMLPQGYQAPIHDSQILTVHFPINSASLSDSAKTLIQDAMMPWLETSGYVVLINGYTDNTGTPIINEELSTMRAKLVADEIMTYGIDEYSVNWQGWGEANPQASNDTEIGRDLNRRVEVIIRR